VRGTQSVWHVCGKIRPWRRSPGSRKNSAASIYDLSFSGCARALVNSTLRCHLAQPPFAAAIIETPSMAGARMTAVVRRLAPGVPFGEGLKLNAEMMTLIPPKQIGGILSGDEAMQLILQLDPVARALPQIEGTVPAGGRPQTASASSNHSTSPMGGGCLMR
jgi:hypothetical protein